MAGFNKVMLIGNLTRDPQVRVLPSQTTVAEFGLATNRKYRTAAGEDKEEVCFVDCSAFGKQAEVIGQFCQKGKMLFVEGRLKFDSWEDKVGGGKRSKLSVVVENFQFLGSRSDELNAAGESGGDAGRGDRPPSRQPPASRQQTSTRQGGPPAGGREQRPRQSKQELAERASMFTGKPDQAPQDPPFGQEKVFEEADIPF